MNSQNQNPEQSISIVHKQKTEVVSKAYGKGKIIQRKQGSGRIILPPARRASDLSPEEIFRYARWLEEGSIRSLDLNNSEHNKEACALLRKCGAAHMLNSGLLQDSDASLKVASLAELIGTTDIEYWACMDESNSFLQCDTSKNLYGSEYHVREPSCASLVSSFSEFQRCLAQWKSKNVFLKWRLREVKLVGEDKQIKFCQGNTCPDILHSLLDKCINWKWLQDLKRRHRLGDILSADLEISGRNALLPAQYQTDDRMLLQVTGTRSILLFDPNQTFEGIYPFPVHHPYDTYSMVDWEKPDCDEWPMSQQVRGKVCNLKPGDVLFVPACWSVHQQLRGEENITLSFSLGMGYRVRPNSVLGVKASRVVEEILVDLDGPGKIKYWIDIIVKEADDEVIDKWTVKGYLQIEAVWDAREEIEFVLGKGAWRCLLPAMSEGRLTPTPWLNKIFREPLYLMDKPRVIPDTRTEEQRRYPELFRHVQ